MRIEDFDRAKVLVERLQEMRELHPKLERASDRHPFFIMHIPVEVLKFVPAVEAANALLPLLETELRKTEEELETLGVTLPLAEETKPETHAAHALMPSATNPLALSKPPEGYTLLSSGAKCECSFLWTDGLGHYWCCAAIRDVKGIGPPGHQRFA